LTMIGNTISHYKIIDKIGEGGMGAVWKAEDTTLGRLVALKTLSQHLSKNEEARQRFIREAQAASSLNHPNITIVHELVEDKDSHLICMEYVEGKTIRDMLEGGRISVKKAINITLQAAEALEAAHRKEILHRDIKSANIMVTMEGRVKVMDFGLAHLGERSQLTRTGTLMGTLAYASPEQIAGRPVDARSEIWSLGIVLYEMLAAKLPFDAANEAELLFGIINNEPTHLSEIREDIDFLTEGVLARMLEKDPINRYQSMGELVTDLQALHRDMETGSTSVLKAFEQIKKRQQRIRSYRLVVAAVTIGALIGTGLLLLKPGQIVHTPPSIVVTSFANETGDNSLNHLGTNLERTLTTALSQAGICEVVEQGSNPSLSISGSILQINTDEIEVTLTIRNISTKGVLGLSDRISLNSVRGNLQDFASITGTVGDRVVGALAFYLDERFRYYIGEMTPPPSYEIYRSFRDGWENGDPQKCLEASRLDTTYMPPVLWATWFYMDNRPRNYTSADSLISVCDSRASELRIQEQYFLQWLHLHHSGAGPEDRLNTMREMAELAPWSNWNSSAGYWAVRSNYLEEAVSRIHSDLLTVYQHPEIYSRDPNRMDPSTMSSMTLFDYCSALYQLGHYQKASRAIHDYRNRVALSTQDSMWADILEIQTLALMGKNRQAMALFRHHCENQTYTNENWPVIFRNLPLMLRVGGADQESLDRVLLFAEQWYSNSQLADPNNYQLAQIRYVCGQFEQARTSFEILYLNNPNSGRRLSYQHYLGCIAARLGETSIARQYVQTIEDEREFTSPTANMSVRARILALTGDVDAAAILLQEAFSEGLNYLWSTAQPWGCFLYDLEPLRGNVIFQELMRPKK
ncbi:protein kinase, partial [Candidatus Zixiibacteriota bacterium]